MLQITMPRRRTLLVTTAILAVALPLVTYASFRGRSIENSPPVISEITEVSGTQLEVELITLRPFGFEPSEINRPKGAFVLFIDDRSGKQNSSLTLQRLNGERLRAVNLNRNKSEWHDVIELPPGTYVLHDASNPELRCRVMILP